MPVRATKLGPQRTPFPPGADADVLVCGASFAGLAVARELRAAGVRVLVLDRYEIGERQTSACAAPTEWLRNLGLEASIRQTFGSLVVHTPGAHARWPLPFTFSTFDYRQLCELLWDQSGDARFDVAKVEGRAVPPSGRRTRRPAADGTSSGRPQAPADGDTLITIQTDRGDVTAPLIVDALGWRRVLGAGENVQPPEARLSRGLEVHPGGRGAELELWIDPRYVLAGYGWSFPAGDEVRIGVGSFEPRDHVKEPTLRLVADVDAEPRGYQGNWIPHRIRPATEDGVLFVGDSAGHCLPLTAEGIRTAFYFGVAAGRELAAVVAGRRDTGEALRRYRAFSRAHAWKFEAMLAAQRAVRHLHGPPMDALVHLYGRPRVARWTFRHYLDIAPPSFALPAPPPAPAASAGRAILAAAS
jgi:flavin-dependent dehydrogenase